MKVVKTIAEMKAERRRLGTLGFVPTMGYLHEGHLSLVRRARLDNDGVAVSIFVNPSQFGPKEDFDKYPRDYDRDLRMLEKEQTDIVFMPSVQEMYPPGYETWITLENITKRLEGGIRPGHFRGVATVVAKLFNIVEPTVAYFGQKDAQQCLVIKKMAADLNMNLQVKILPTLREPDGLAMSSRNVYLKRAQRKGAVVLSEALTLAYEMFSGGETNAETIRRAMTELIEREPLGKVEYISIASNETLEELETVTPPALVSLAVKFGTTRLIDNIVLD